MTSASLNAAPVDVAGYLRRRLFESDTSVIMTSATLGIAAKSGAEAETPRVESRSAPFREDRRDALRRPFPYGRDAVDDGDRDTQRDHQPEGRRQVAGGHRRGGERAIGDELALRNEDHAGDGEYQHQRDGQQRIDRAVGDAVLGQDQGDRAIHDAQRAKAGKTLGKVAGLATARAGKGTRILQWSVPPSSGICLRRILCPV